MKKWLQKACDFCVYQERYHREVREKLISWGANENQADEVITWLIENNFLNEGRYAKQYAGGKFRVKKWGKRKIVFELKRRGISNNSIKDALTEIADDDYLLVLGDLISKKISGYQKSESQIVAKQKTIKWLISRGFETDLIYDIINSRV